MKVDKSGDALVLACIRDEVRALELIKAGVQVPASQRVYALELCVANRQLRVLAALVASDAQVEKLLTHRDVMLQAILSGNVKLVDRLVMRGAELPANLLDLAITADSYQLAERALRAHDALKKAGPSSGAHDAMCRAAWKGDIRMMKLLAKAGVPLHPMKPGETSPLRKAASAGDKAMVAVNGLSGAVSR